MSRKSRCVCVNEKNYCPATLFAMCLNDRVTACQRDSVSEELVWVVLNPDTWRHIWIGVFTVMRE